MKYKLLDPQPVFHTTPDGQIEIENQREGFVLVPGDLDEIIRGGDELFEATVSPYKWLRVSDTLAGGAIYWVYLWRA